MSADNSGGFRNVVCGVDGSEAALEAVRQGAVLGEEGARVWAMSAWDPRIAALAGLQAEHFKRELHDDAQGALRRAQETVPQVQSILYRGSDVAALLAATANLDADLLCVGSHGSSRAAGVLFGSVASAMAHYAPCSTLVARPPPTGDFPGIVLHADDGSPESLAAADVAARIAGRHGSRVITLHVGKDSDEATGQAIAILRERVPGAEARVEEGTPKRKVIEVASELGSSLIVMGSRGQTGLRALGSVSESVAHHAEGSVLIVREAAYAEPDED